jgi:hypothetical protein
LLRYSSETLRMQDPTTLCPNPCNTKRVHRVPKNGLEQSIHGVSELGRQLQTEDSAYWASRRFLFLQCCCFVIRLRCSFNNLRLALGFECQP